ncbi:MAG: hydrogenase maturation nickel metallochaperone HypA [Nitrospiraceae bacterium]|nr:MAG: hydrogenase maturation nickel metallochaperone HypA [Nitrospiraceae bacterium]
MHEVSIALAMVDELMRIAAENGAKKITKVSLKIGRLSGIVTDSLVFAFDAIKQEHPLLSSADISIHEIPLIYQCEDCMNRFEAREIHFPSCPACTSVNLKILSGEEQHIENVELEV